MKQIYKGQLTFKIYALATVLFATYGGRVCPMLETLSPGEILLHSGIVFSLMFACRHFICNGTERVNTIPYSRIDTLLFFAFSIPFALFYALVYQFPIDSNLKVLFGMTLFGFLSGFILELDSRITQADALSQENKVEISLTGKRQSMVKQAISLVILLILALTATLTMIAVKDVYWLEHNPQLILDGSGQISIIKEFIYIGLVLGGYSIYIMLLWSRLMKKILSSHESSLDKVTRGNIKQRLTIFSNDELGSVASLTNSMLNSLEQSQFEIQTTRDVAIVSLSALAESRDNETGGHILRTQEYVKALAEELAKKKQYQTQLTPEYVELLYKSAPLHDVGKVGIPDNILLKPGKLTDEEFAIMKTHPQIGADALSIAEKQLGSNSFLQVAKEISLTHHEKWDGSGYPNQLSGESIPLAGRLMALADVYDALISKRVYKPAFSHDKAKQIILEGSGSHFAPEVVEAFLKVESQFTEIAARHKDSEQLS